MYKFVMFASLGLASLVGLHNATKAGESSVPSRASVMDAHAAQTTAAGRVQYFGPWTKKMAEERAKAWRRKGYTCDVVENPSWTLPSGWYVAVTFKI